MDRHEAVSPSDGQLSAALCAYVATVPLPRRLDAHLAATGASGSRDAIRLALDEVIGEIERSFAALPRDACFDAVRERELLERLRRDHGWLDAKSCRALSGFARWYAWHEGFQPPPSRTPLP
jgi:hypothetical protein